jgi:transcriptional regulator with XRE-family HTH domain
MSNSKSATPQASQLVDAERLAFGQKIRSLRMAADMTLQDLASAVSVSQSLISQVERGLASPSITSLRRIAAALGVPVAALFADGTSGSDENDRSGRRLVVRKHERKKLRVPPSRVAYELLTPDLNRDIEFIWIEYEAGSVTHPEPMSHPGEENAVCLEGTVVVTIEGEEFTLSEGDSISFDSGRPHKVENRGTERAVLVSAITPPAF